MPKERQGNKNSLEKYGLKWEPNIHPVSIELTMIRRGGRWIKDAGGYAGEGLFFHYKRLQELLWPQKEWHRWNLMVLEELINNRFIGIMGPASSGKTCEAGVYGLCTYYSLADQTTVMVSSTEKERLEDRVWGEIKKFHKIARAKCEWLPGELLESRQRLLTDVKFADSDGRDFRNGMVGIPCKKGGSYVGLGAFAGTKNKRVILIADEGQFMPQAYVDAISNLNKNAGFQCIVIGNPKDTTDALGKICEPSAELGGWDGGIDQTGGTKKWKTRFPGGVCIQLVGSDSPNMDFPEDQPPRYPYLITREAIASDVAFYGRDSLQFSMMNDGRMPRGQGLRRVITRQMCQKFDALVEPVWVSEKRTKIGFLDAAYGSVGGDRCIFGELQFGPGLARDGTELILLALIQTMLVPVSIKENELPEDQIAKFCKEQCEARGIPAENFGFDSTGRGTLMGAFARLWSAYVVPIEFGGKATDRQVSAENYTLCRDFYSKFVSELWYSVRLTIESRQFRGMTEEVMQEGTMREWKLVTGNRVEVESKVEMKDKMGRSPDLFDALVAGVEMARRKGFMIAKLGKTRSVSDPDWKQKLRERAAKLARAGDLTYT
jgi:hypothetical protein